ncbi:hypothetical protein M1L60_41135 [Actinoplanes sp. TRM 88003]|uniref:Uncharacterized protein n=1 Tax=Paractinoplanes aksuensis TaxID=2939490 RepID=A0ABT1E1L5_9ACTN|nr:hypothetical protein [Actinoplanes aksuensis]MCO8277002.1 hypothetical protein [Actinoplanes aksuensis]
MNRLRRRFRVLGGAASAVSYADTGPYAGAPRNPGLRIGDEKSYSTIVHTETRDAWLPPSPERAEDRRRGNAV